MQRIILIRRQRPGFLLMEVLIGITVFSLFVSAIGYTLLYGQENTIMAGDRIRATHLTQRALDATRSIRDGAFSSVTTGTHGVWVDRTTKKWAFSGSQVISSGGYVTKVTVESLATDWVRVTGETKWKHGYNRSGAVLITTELTDWGAAKPVGNWANFTLEGSWTDAGTPVMSSIALYGNYLFAGSDTSGGGRGLYIFDITTLTAPSRINSSFNLGHATYDLAVKGQRLYVLNGDNSNEIRVYDITTPSGISPGTTVTTYNLPGSGRARSLALRGTTLIVGAAESGTAGEDEVYTFDISNSGSIVLQDSLDDASTVYGIAVSGTAAILATSDNGAEMKYVKVDVPANISFPVNQGYNATDTPDGTAIAITGTSAVLGRANGSSIEEMLLFEMEGGGGYDVPPPGPWFHEAGGGVNDIALDPTGCYAFLATSFATKDMQAVKLPDTALPEADSYDTSTGFGRGIYYDITRDRVYMVTDSALLIFKPGSGSNSCS